MSLEFVELWHMLLLFSCQFSKFFFLSLPLSVYLCVSRGKVIRQIADDDDAWLTKGLRTVPK